MTLAPSYKYRPALVFLGLAIVLLVVERLVVLSPSFETHAALPAAVTFDLLVGIPALFYWQIIRRYQVPLITLVAAFGGAVALGYGLLPEPYHYYLDWVSQGIILVEAFLVLTALSKLRRIAQAYRAATKQSADFLENLTVALATVLGKAFGLLAFELALFRYAALGWGAKVECSGEQQPFSSHRDSGFNALIATACMLSVIETAAVHLLVQRWSPGVAWLLLVLDLYTLLFLLAHLQAVRLRPTLLTTEYLLIRVGIVWQVRVNRQNIAAVQRIADAPPTAPGVMNLAKQLVTVPNLLLTFTAPVIVTGPYGMQRTVHKLALYVDVPSELLRALLPSDDAKHG